ncbi:ABC transporter permease [Phyllobacterium myrsinacearum]|uniref:Transport permease protein n=1 Tax=Phyllobacterium myrsinacearum TaxID=28101 RepID=A0A839F0I7_9HYPH|nr:ABC transporter permease [Phyllobacterium myrsinacearum]MBA8882127.1 lipopolysaccharide transport system permease protein [Phyllobacterium myrsinacearum]
MKKVSISPLALVASLVQHRQLLLDMAWRETIGRYKGSMFGLFWSLLTPLMMLGIYTFVFSEIFKSRWGADTHTSKSAFAIILFAGLIMFNMFAECASKAPSIILSNQNYVKKVVFPLEILACVNALSALFHAAVSFLVLLAFQYFGMGEIPLTALFAVLIIVPFMFFLLGLMWFLSAAGVYLRDIGQTIGVTITGMMFVSPIFFPLSSYPERWRFLAAFNPLTYPIEQVRSVVIFGNSLDWYVWTQYVIGAAVFAWLGFAWFQKTRKGFADVL